jgi:flavin reductase (DIM6/NTAB) family NADH-FMN oxidoreductase RutF
VPAETVGVPGSPAALRSVMAEFATGVIVVTALRDGQPHAMTATAFCSVSLDPPLVLVSVGHASRFHPVITDAGRWAVSLLAEDQEPLARRFSDPNRDLARQYDGVDYQAGPATGSPVLVGALGWLECATRLTTPAGDHTLVLGEILRASGARSDREPLTYYRGTYHRSPGPGRR